METYAAPSAAIVPEFLRRANYKYWRACMESYLEAQGLWETISSNTTDFVNFTNAREWKRKDKAALHAIQISCGPEFFSEIEDIRHAKAAWEILANKLNPQPESEQPPQPQPQGSDDSGDQVPAEPIVDQLRAQKDERTGHIAKGDLKGLKAMLDEYPDLINATIGFGSTALSEACLLGHKDMAKYLYTKTSIDFLSQENGKHACDVLRSCMWGKTLDIALDLLHRLPDSGKMDVIKYSGILFLLSLQPEVFRSGLGLAFWQRWIYWSQYPSLALS